MALQSEIIPFTLRNGTGTQVVSHILFPGSAAKSIIFMSVVPPGVNREAYSFGIDDGITHIGNSMSGTELFGVHLTARMWSSQYSLTAVHSQASFGGASQQVRGYVSSITTGNFTLTFTLNSMAGAQWYAIVISGTDVSCKVGTINPHSPNLPVTASLGFDPIAIITLNTGILDPTNSVSGATADYGFAVPCHGLQVCWSASTGPINSDSRNFQLAGIVDAKVDDISSIGSAPLAQRNISAYPANGFTLDGSNLVTFSDWYFGYLAIGGSAVAANLVSINQPSVLGIQDIATDAFFPKLAFFGSTNHLTSSVISANFNFTFGVYDGINQVTQWMGDLNGAPNPYKQHGRSSTSSCILMATPTGPATSIINAQASCVGFSPNKVSLNWSTVDSTAREIWMLLLGDGTAAGPCGGNPGEPGAGIYKQVVGRTNDRLFV